MGIKQESNQDQNCGTKMSHWLSNIVSRGYSGVKIAMSTVAMISRDNHANKKKAL
jgi:hypothetical protein